MRIAQIAPLAESVPPKLYGGTERVVAWLVDELIEVGHEVTLFASGDSMTGAQLNAVCPRALRLGRPRTDPMAVQAALIEEVACKANNFDVIHAHIAASAVTKQTWRSFSDHVPWAVGFAALP
jgi:glycosyltransferase involved in cell wall biosynthesis